ncbi:MAG: ATP phosphoribosyltransferase [candidate division NC10 bacterium]|nr:ATP phosphoribosyltransferase [candidate division NC10 bacterium]MDE2484402.1 ATP phosphoribosyltransferase [candidate division NC10 bacterium]
MESTNNDVIAIALPKGRLLPHVLALFKGMGITCLQGFADSRRLIYEDPYRCLQFLTLKPADIPTYVEHGAADMGIVGKDQLLEQRRDVYEPLDLRFGACRLVVAEPAELHKKDDPYSWSHLRLATKYPNLAEAYFSSKGIQAEIITLNGSLELAPLVGLAERIVDLVETGQTLKENGLVEVEEIAKSTARLIVNRASLKTKYRRVQALIEQMRKQVEAQAERARA